MQKEQHWWCRHCREGGGIW